MIDISHYNYKDMVLIGNYLIKLITHGDRDIDVQANSWHLNVAISSLENHKKTADLDANEYDLISTIYAQIETGARNEIRSKKVISNYNRIINITIPLS